MKRWAAILLVVLCLATTFARSSEVLAHGEKYYGEETSVCLEYQGRRWTYGAREYFAKSRIHTVEGEARRMRRATHAERMRLCEELVSLGLGYRVAVEQTFLGISKVTAAAKRRIDIEAKPAEIYFYPSLSEFKIKREKCGYNINLENLYKNVYLALKNSRKIEVSLNPQILHHEITSEVLASCCNKRAEFTTRYERSSAERKHNVALALSKLNGYRLDKGDTLSFNTVVGARTARRGFKEAKIIKNGQFEDGVGGGVCQSSTTLYNASLLGGLKVLKVYQHSLPVGYVEPSFDAMVNSSFADLVITSEDNLPVFIRTECTDTTAKVEIFGSPLPYRIVRKSKVTGKVAAEGDRKIIDKDGKYADYVKYKGDVVRISAPREGLTSLGFLEYYEGDRLIKTEQIRKNKYAAQKGLLVEGALTPPPPDTDGLVDMSESAKRRDNTVVGDKP